MAGAQKKIVIVICNDPDATDSSSDEDEPLVKVFNNKNNNKRKRLVREILLPAIATDVSWLPVPIGQCRKPLAKKKKKMTKKKSRYLSRGMGGGRLQKRWSKIPSSNLGRASGIANSGYGLLKDLPCLAKMPNSTIAGIASSSYDRLENFPDDTTVNFVASPKRAGEDKENDKDKDQSLLCFVSNDKVVVEEEKERGMTGESLVSLSSSSLAVEQKGVSLGLGELLPSLDGTSSSFSHSPLAEELDRILGLMNPGHDPVVGNFSDYHSALDASEASGGGYFDLSFDLDCDSLAWANVPEGCIA